MPKITTITREIAGERVDLVVGYNVKDKFHISGGITDKMRSLMDWHKLFGHESLPQLEAELTRQVGSYNTQLKTERKVLLVTVSLGRATVTALELPRNHPLHNFGGMSSYRAAPGYGFDMKVEVALETAVAGKKAQYRYPNQPEDIFGYSRGSYTLPDVVPDLTRIIDYTPEREEYFRNLLAATIEIGRKISDFFHEDEQLFLKNVDGGQQLLSQ